MVNPFLAVSLCINCITIFLLYAKKNDGARKEDNEDEDISRREELVFDEKLDEDKGSQTDMNKDDNDGKKMDRSIHIDNVDDAFDYLKGIDDLSEKCISIIVGELEKIKSLVPESYFMPEEPSKDVNIITLNSDNKKESTSNYIVCMECSEVKRLLNEQICTLKNKIIEMEKEREELHLNFEMIYNSLSKLEYDYADSVVHSRLCLDNCNDEIFMLNLQLDEANKKCNNLELICRKAEDSQFQFVNKIEEITNKYKESKNQVKELQDKIGQLLLKEEEMVRKFAIENEGIKKEYKGYKDENEKIKEKLESSLADMNKVVESLETRIICNTERYEKLKANLKDQDELCEEIESLTRIIESDKENEGSKNKIHEIELQNEIDGMKNENLKLKEINRKFICKNVEQAKELQELKVAIQELRKSSDKKNTSVESIESMVTMASEVFSKYNGSTPLPESFEPLVLKKWLIESIENLRRKSYEKEVFNNFVEKIIEKVGGNETSSSCSNDIINEGE